MNIVDQLIVLSVLRQVEDDLHLCVQIENKITHNLCHLISVYAEDAKEKNLCLEYLHSEKPSETNNKEFVFGRYTPGETYWWSRYDEPIKNNGFSQDMWEGNEDHITECHKQRLEFVRHLIWKLEDKRCMVCNRPAVKGKNKCKSCQECLEHSVKQFKK